MYFSTTLDKMADDNNGQEVREQDRYLPVANLSRIMKRALPASSKVSKDSKDLMRKFYDYHIEKPGCAFGSES